MTSLRRPSPAVRFEVDCAGTYGRFSSLCAFGRQLAPLALAGGAFLIAHPHRGDAVPGAVKVSALAASGRYRRRGAVVLVPGAVDSLRRIPAPVGGPRGPEFSSCIGHLRLVAEAEDGSCETVFIGTKVPLQGQVG